MWQREDRWLGRSKVIVNSVSYSTELGLKGDVKQKGDVKKNANTFS